MGHLSELKWTSCTERTTNHRKTPFPRHSQTQQIQFKACDTDQLRPFFFYLIRSAYQLGQGTSLSATLPSSLSHVDMFTNIFLSMDNNDIIALTLSLRLNQLIGPRATVSVCIRPRASCPGIVQHLIGQEVAQEGGCSRHFHCFHIVVYGHGLEHFTMLLNCNCHGFNLIVEKKIP